MRIGQQVQEMPRAGKFGEWFEKFDRLGWLRSGDRHPTRHPRIPF